MLVRVKHPEHDLIFSIVPARLKQRLKNSGEDRPEHGGDCGKIVGLN